MINKALKEGGAALIVVMCAVLMVGGVSILGGQHFIASQQQSSREVTQSLARAKAALLNYAVNYADNYGHNTRGGVGRLPCPARQPHARPAMSCGRNALGFLPAVWSRDGKQMDIDHQEYFLDQNLWYSVSADFRYNPAFNRLNPGSHDNFLLVEQHDEIVAVIISPGAALPGQRRDGEVFLPSAYLEGDNADFDSEFQISAESNDRLVTISRAELLPLIERRVLGFVRDWLLEYQSTHGHLPFAARLGDPEAACEQGLTVGTISMSRGNCDSPSLGELVSQSVPAGRRINQTWFGNYGWSVFLFYQADASCIANGQSAPCSASSANRDMTVNGESASGVVISTGRALQSEYLGSMQDRVSHPEARSSYLDTDTLVHARQSFEFSHLDAPLPPASNDQFLVLQ